MIEKELITYFKSVMSDVPVGFEAPLKKPDKYVVFTMLDGGEINHIKAATISADCYAVSLLKAAELCEVVKTHMLDMIRLDSISGVYVGNVRSNTDTNTKTYCYECVFNFYYY